MRHQHQELLTECPGACGPPPRTGTRSAGAAESTVCATSPAEGGDCTPARARAERELALEVLQHHGFVTLRALGTSMLPTLWPGDLLRIERTNAQVVGLGDLVLFRREERLYIHRLIAIGPSADGALITRGDSLPQADPPFSPGQLLGRVTGVTREGRAIPLKRNPGLMGRMVSCLLRQAGWRGCAVLLKLHGWRRRIAGPGARVATSSSRSCGGQAEAWRCR
jgi:hypothetical protein